MSDILCKYRPISFLPLYRKKWLSFPERLEDLSREQFIALSSYINDPKKWNLYLSAMTGLRKNLCRKFDELQVYHLIYETDPIFETEGTDKHFFIEVPYKGNILHGFHDNFKYTKFGEFIFADTYYQAYRGGDIEMLDKFIAILYRPKNDKDTGDQRIEFREDEVSTREALVNTFSLKLKKAIALNYALMRKNLEKKFPFVFPETNEPCSGSGSWIDVYDSVVGDDMIHSKEYADLYLTSVMRKINKAIKEEIRRNK